MAENVTESMEDQTTTVAPAAGRHQVRQLDRRRAERCLKCPLCRRARSKQRGLAYWLVKRVERRLCPWCRAYEKVYGRPAHQKLDQQ